MNRGSPVRIRRSSIRAEAFNEAPIHESGKSGADPPIKHPGGSLQ